jgi:hypothetical protein
MLVRYALAAVLAAGAALPVVSAPAKAETTVIRSEMGDNGVVIRHHSDRGWHHGWQRHHRDVYGSGCRTTTVRRETDRGVVVKRIRKCY